MVFSRQLLEPASCNKKRLKLGSVALQKAAHKPAPTWRHPQTGEKALISKDLVCSVLLVAESRTILRRRLEVRQM